jgi:hypothetical protein
LPPVDLFPIPVVKGEGRVKGRRVWKERRVEEGDEARRRGEGEDARRGGGERMVFT